MSDRSPTNLADNPPATDRPTHHAASGLEFLELEPGPYRDASGNPIAYDDLDFSMVACSFDDGFEWPGGYTQGGYAPVHLGETLNNRYTIVYKLSASSSSTVWLARDNTSTPRSYVALKILKADKALSSSQLANQSYLRHSAIMPIIDTFQYSSPNGIHQIHTMPILWPISSLQITSIEQIKNVFAQLLHGLAYLHRNQMICHGLSCDRVGYFSIPLTDAQVESLPAQVVYPVPDWAYNRAHGRLPNGIVSFDEWQSTSYDLGKVRGLSPRVCLTGFGSSFFAHRADGISRSHHTEFLHSVPPKGLSAEQVDIRTLGYVMYELIAFDQLPPNDSCPELPQLNTQDAQHSFWNDVLRQVCVTLERMKVDTEISYNGKPFDGFSRVLQYTLGTNLQGLPPSIDEVLQFLEREYGPIQGSLTPA